mgnify:FL=1|jgi:hypothetical protein
MELKEIKEVVDSGKTVYWGNKLYVVVCNKGQYLVKCTTTDDRVDLDFLYKWNHPHSRSDGKVLTGEPNEFLQDQFGR